jgi:hypothetical protein
MESFAVRPARPSDAEDLARNWIDGAQHYAELDADAFQVPPTEGLVVRTRVRSPQTNGVIERFFGTLKYEHLYRAPIDDGGALAMETARFRDIYNRIRPHQALDDRTPRQAYLDT